MTCKGELNIHLFITIVARIVGLATRYELVRGSNPGGADIFRQPSRPALGLTQPPT